MLSRLLSVVEPLSPVPQFPHVIRLEGAVKSMAWAGLLYRGFFAVPECAALLGVRHLGYDLQETSVQAGAAQGGKSGCAARKTEPRR